MYKFDQENHIHLLNGQPLMGTSSMASVLAKPLTYWASGLAVEKFGWMNKGNTKTGFVKKEVRLAKSTPRRKEIEKLDDEGYLKLLDEAYSAHATKLKDSAGSGTDMHAVMEEYVKWCIETNYGVPTDMKSTDKKLNFFIEWSRKNVKKFLWSEAHCYSKELWLGGISDCGYEDMNGKYAILDFKSSKDVYLSQFWQCVGYAMQIEENGLFTPEGELIMKLDKPISYVSVLPFGMDKPEVSSNEDMKGGAEAVKAMLLLYKKLN
jgi:hypothetical protein